MDQVGPDKMDRVEAEGLILSILNSDRTLERSVHFWDQAAARHFGIQDVFRLLKAHTLVGDPEWDAEHGNFKVVLDGKSLGRPTRVVLGLRRVGPCSLITIHRIRGKRRKP